MIDQIQDHELTSTNARVPTHGGKYVPDGLAVEVLKDKINELVEEVNTLRAVLQSLKDSHNRIIGPVNDLIREKL